MNYCSISDAWGSKNNNIENVQPHNNIQSVNSNIKEHFESVDSTIKEHFELTNDKKIMKLMSCDEIFEHINTCRYCNERIRLKYKSNLINNFTHNNKDTCVLILVAVFVYLFFKLLNKF